VATRSLQAGVNWPAWNHYLTAAFAQLGLLFEMCATVHHWQPTKHCIAHHSKTLCRCSNFWMVHVLECVPSTMVSTTLLTAVKSLSGASKNSFVPPFAFILGYKGRSPSELSWNPTVKPDLYMGKWVKWILLHHPVPCTLD